MEAKIAWDSEVQRIKPMKSLSERLYDNDDWTFHSRTSELIHNCYAGKKRNPYKYRAILGGFPCVTHHQKENRSCGATLRIICWCDYEDSPTVKQIIDESMTMGKPTKQFETVWYSKGQRRK